MIWSLPCGIYPTFYQLHNFLFGVKEYFVVSIQFQVSSWKTPDHFHIFFYPNLPKTTSPTLWVLLTGNPREENLLLALRCKFNFPLVKSG